MSQTTTIVRRNPAGATAARAAAPPGPAPRGRLARAFEGTPRKLRAAAVVGVLVSLVFAFVGGNAFRARSDALDQARADAAQLVRVQQIATDLVTADALVTNAFLGSGQQGSLAAPGYDEAIADASKALADASRSQPGDAAALGTVNDLLTRYTAAVAAAQTSNAQNLEVAQAYLRQASDLLRNPTTTRTAMLPMLNEVLRTDAQRVDDAFAAADRASLVLVVAGLVGLAGLLGVQVWLARRVRRIFNVPLTVGTVLVLLTLVLGALTMLFTQSSLNTVRDTDYAATKALSQARIAAFDAKSNESLTLVDQSARTRYEQLYQTRAGTAREQLAVAGHSGAGDAGQGEFETWTGVHKKITDADTKGQWTQAASIATGESNQRFQAFDSSSSAALRTEAQQVADNLGSPHLVLLALAWLTLLVGLAAAATAWVGVSQRLGEYR